MKGFGFLSAGYLIGFGGSVLCAIVIALSDEEEGWDRR